MTLHVTHDVHCTVTPCVITAMKPSSPSRRASGPRQLDSSSHFCLKNKSPAMIGIVFGLLFTVSGLTLLLTTELGDRSPPSWETKDADPHRSLCERRIASWTLMGVGIPLFVICVVVVYVVKRREGRRRSDQKRMSYRDWVRSQRTTTTTTTAPKSEKLKWLSDERVDAVPSPPEPGDGPPPYSEAVLVPVAFA